MNMHKMLKLLLVVFLSVNFALGDETNAPKTTINYANEATSVHLLLILQKTTFTNGEPILISGVLSNVTDSPGAVRTSDGEIGLDFIVSDTNNQPVARKNDGARLFSSGGIAKSLPAHGCITNTIALDKRYKFELGTYQISAKREMALRPPWGSNTVTSLIVSFTIVGAVRK